MNNIRLTVIIPGYENPSWRWFRCVDSVLAVLGPDDELVCVDDGSLQSKLPDFNDSRIRPVVLERNGGLSVARNAGLDAARGRYVTFVDSDDEVMGDVYAKTLAQMEATGSDVGFFGVLTDWVEDGLVCTDRADTRVYGNLTAADANDLRERRLLNPAWNKVYSRAFLDRTRLRFDPDGMPCEDIIFNLGCIMAGARWCSVDVLGYRYNHTSHSLLGSYRPRNIIGLRHARDAWRAYKAFDPGAVQVFGCYGEPSDDDLERAEKKNVRRKSPLYRFLRKLLYVRPIRRWNICRTNGRIVDRSAVDMPRRRPVYVVTSSYFPTPESWRCAFVYDQVMAIRRTGRCRVVFVNTHYDHDYTYAGAEVFACRRMSRFGFLLGPIQDVINFRRTVRCLKAHGIDPQDVMALHCHLISSAPAVVNFKKVNPRTKAIVQIQDPDGLGTLLSNQGHGLFNRIKRILCYLHHRRLIEKADAVVAIARNVQKSIAEVPRQTVYNTYEPMRESMRDLRWCRSPRVKRFVLLHNNVDKKQFYPKPAERRTGFTIGYVANVMDWKDPMSLLRALIILKGKLGDWRLRMVGSGPKMAECKQIIAEGGIGDRVEWISEMDHSFLPDFYRTLDLFCVPSYFEGYGCVFAEAHACGVPFITCEGQGMDDLIYPEDRHLWLCKERNPEDLAKKILYYFENRPQQRLAAETDIDVTVPRFLDEVKNL